MDELDVGCGVDGHVALLAGGRSEEGADILGKQDVLVQQDLSAVDQESVTHGPQDVGPSTGEDIDLPLETIAVDEERGPHDELVVGEGRIGVKVRGPRDDVGDKMTCS